MKYSDTGFRSFYHQFVLFPITVAGSAVSDFKCFSEADSIVTYGYVDHETGFRFEVLSTASIRNDQFQIFNRSAESFCRLDHILGSYGISGISRATIFRSRSKFSFVLAARNANIRSVGRPS